MNPALKHWKEAATLILAAGQRLAAPLADASGSRLGRRHLPDSCDYDVLLLKRSSRSRFMPNAYVFPGGMVDASDFSNGWLDVFKRFTHLSHFGLRRVKQPEHTRPPMFSTDRRKLGTSVPGEVAFRICALRETFEESGVLLSVSNLDEKSLLRSIEDSSSAEHQAPPNKANQLCSSELSRWRTLVNQDPSNFIKMCRELEVMPNIWALHEWSNWLTPKGRYGTKRFDTAFFICCLQDVPDALQDQREIERLQWSSPPDTLQSYRDKEFWIAPPQFYELSRLCRLPSLNDLHRFARQRAVEGCEQWLPVGFQKDEEHMSLLPGDKLYPLDSSGEVKVDESSEPQGGALHRMLFSDLNTGDLQITITPKYNHLSPVDPSLRSRL